MKRHFSAASVFDLIDLAFPIICRKASLGPPTLLPNLCCERLPHMLADNDASEVLLALRQKLWLDLEVEGQLDVCLHIGEAVTLRYVRVRRLEQDVQSVLFCFFI